MAKSNNWTTMAESKFPWERDALDFVREQFPSRDAYRAWSNFEFIADDGSINEVDLLVFTPQGFFLIEIKSRPGRLFGDAGTWTWETDGKLRTVDNPLIAANLKAKKLRTLLQRQKAFKKKGQPRFVEALVFCSVRDLRCELQGNARYRVCLRDRERSEKGSVRKRGQTPFAFGKAEKGSDPICAEHPSGRSGKWGLTPFPNRQQLEIVLDSAARRQSSHDRRQAGSADRARATDTDTGKLDWKHPSREWQRGRRLTTDLRKY